jgi:hypothetical protein
MSQFDRFPIFEWVGSKEDVNIKAFMRISESGQFVVLAGSICRGDKLPYQKYSQKSIELLKSVSKKHKTHYYKMEQDLAFDCVSDAAHLVCSSITVPWENWKCSLRGINDALEGNVLNDKQYRKSKKK